MQKKILLIYLIIASSQTIHCSKASKSAAMSADDTALADPFDLVFDTDDNSANQSERHTTLLRQRKTTNGFVDKKLQCHQCSASFTRQSNYAIHQHQHTGEQPYKCSKCDKSFNHPSNRSRHERVCIYKKLYTCDTCDATFAHYSTLISHKNKHTGHKPHACNECNATFSLKALLLKHSLVHMRNDPLQCNQCTASFTRRECLARHENHDHLQQTTFSQAAPKRPTRAKKA